MIDFTVPLADLDRAASNLDQAARKIASIGGSPEGGRMIQAEIAFQANTSVIRNQR